MKTVQETKILWFLFLSELKSFNFISLHNLKNKRTNEVFLMSQSISYKVMDIWTTVFDIPGENYVFLYLHAYFMGKHYPCIAFYAR